MQITLKNSPFFTAIKLNDKEYKKAEEQLKSYNADNADLVQANLYDIFEKHIDKEAKLKSRGIYYSDEIYQNLFLKLFENIENASKEIHPIDFILEKLNSYKTSKEDVKPNNLKGLVSLDAPLRNNAKKTLKTFLTEDNLPVYSSHASKETRKSQQKELSKVRTKTKLGLRASKYLDEYSSGKNYQKIADDNGIERTHVMRTVKSAVLKIQNANNNLPEKYKILAQELKDELAQEFIDYTEKYSQKLVGKNVFDIIIEEKIS